MPAYNDNSSNHDDKDPTVSAQPISESTPSSPAADAVGQPNPAPVAVPAVDTPYVPTAVPAPAAPYYVPASMQYVPAIPKVPPFQATVRDGVFALAAFVLGYLFCRWVLSSVYGWGTAIFTAAFLVSVLIYFRSRGVRPAPASWFWFAVTLLTGLSFALWADLGLADLRSLFLFAAAVYWVLSAANAQLAGKTSNYLLLDGLNGVFILPFRNFVNQYRALGAFKGRDKKHGKKALSVLLGIALAVIALLIVTPQLLRADSGGFSRLMQGFFDLFRFDWPFLEFLFYCLLAIPTAAYLFGLVSGSAAKRAADTFKADKTENTVAALRILPAATAFIVLGAVSVMYIIFIASQLPYFFSAFSGTTPDGWLSYSEYARQGFFELCRLSVVNLLLVTAANILSKKPRPESTVLKVFNILLALITLLLIATAFSKMALYIDAFGLTMPRILPCVFMVFLAVVCISVMLMQKLKFSVVRVALVTGAVLFTALCLMDADALVVRYNTGRYLAGTLSDYDTDILDRAGPAGVPYALEVYNTLPDGNLKDRIDTYLGGQLVAAVSVRGTYEDTLQTRWVRQALDGVPLEYKSYEGFSPLEERPGP
jgi:hypothetical protein